MPSRALELLQNVFDSLRISPPDYLRSVLGDPSSWNPKHCPPTELKLTPAQALRELVQVTVPALPIRPPVPLFPGAGLLFRPCSVMIQPLPHGQPNPTPDEAWMFINGILTDQDVARRNGRYIVELFGRPLAILHDSTCGLVPDLIECAAGKGWGSLTAAGRLALHPLSAALLNPRIKRVVLLAHSRGTIIAATVLHALSNILNGERPPAALRSAEAQAGQQLSREWRAHGSLLQRAYRTEGVQAALKLYGCAQRQTESAQLRPEHLRKLEVYALANCASEMRYVVPASGPEPAAPYIESLGNQNDIVARLGVLAPRKGLGGVHIDGNCYQRPNAWGHLLNAHYLYPLQQDVSAGRKGLIMIDGTLQGSRLEQELIRSRDARYACVA